MMIYLLKSALLLALLYGGFALLLSKETFHRFNRLALLTAMIASLVLPAIQLTMDKPQFLTISSLTPNPSPKDEGNSLSPKKLTLVDEDNIIEEGNSLTPVPSPKEEGSYIDERNMEEDASLPLWGRVEGALYLSGVFASIGFFLFQLLRFWRDTKGGTSTKDEEGNTVVIRGGEFPPYSFLHYIIISVSDYERLRKPILAHEQAHIRLGHSWDLLLLEVVKAIQWFNPFVYLLGRDLKAVHEYEADNAVLNQGIDAKTYQLLLVTKAVGNRLQTLGNNLSHHSLKKRIKMMHKTNSNRWMMTKAVVLPALMALAVIAFAKPKVEDNLLKTQNSSEKLVTFKEDNPNRFAITIPKGIWREAKIQGVTDKGKTYDINKSFIQENTTKSPYWGSEGVTLKLNGKVVEPRELAEIPASELKKMEQNAHEREINLITTPVQIPDSLKNDDDKIYEVVEENAQFSGGEEAMYKWLADHLKYPKECVEKGIQGRVMIQFVVNKDGSITDVKVLKSPSALLSEEAVRVVKAMPKWKPAKVKGETVRSNFRLPINFKLPAKQTATEQGTASELVIVKKVTGEPTGKPIEETADNGIFEDPEEKASFPDGEQAMFKWMADNLKYPKECMEKGIQGRVNVQFTIEKDGSVTNVKALRSPDDALAQEAVRMVSAMPKWNPAKQEEKAVRSNFRLPIMFRLSSAQTEQKPQN